MEKYSYEYAYNNSYTLPVYNNISGVIAMKDLFNMTAGTSTGSILASALSYPVSNKYDS
jgi:patatin-like phospholipase/acyl hydrolase